jgi:transposase
VKSERDARNARDDAAAATDGPLDDAERAELIRLRGELKDANATVAELRMQVEFAKTVATWSAKEQQ